MPASTTGTAVALVVAVDEEVGVDFWAVWDSARMTESVTSADCVGTMEDGRSDRDADAGADADAETAGAALDVLAADALGLGAELFRELFGACATVAAGMTSPTLAVE